MTLQIAQLPGASVRTRLRAHLRRLLSGMFYRITGQEVVVLEGRRYVVRPVPIKVARDLVPAMLRCSERFAVWQVDESMYDDLVKVLCLGLGATKRDIDSLTIPLWELAPVMERIAVVNGLPVVEAGRSDLGKLMTALSTGTN